MIVTFLFILASSFLLVESAIQRGTCPRSEWGTETTEESWECTKEESKCTSDTDTCSHDGSLESVAGTAHYFPDGSGEESGSGWDCRQICSTSD